MQVFECNYWRSSDPTLFEMDKKESGDGGHKINSFDFYLV